MIKYNLKYTLFVALLLSFSTIKAQVLSFDHGKIEFYTTTIVSDIEAVSETVEVKLDILSRAVELKIPIASFEFEYEMMQEHFNEEYLESEQFPDAIFKGKINQDISNLVEAVEVEVSGDLTIHGITKQTTFKATISQKEGFTLVKCKFPVVFKDFKVEEPSILSKSVAKEVTVKSILYLKG